MFIIIFVQEKRLKICRKNVKRLHSIIWPEGTAKNGSKKIKILTVIIKSTTIH